MKTLLAAASVLVLIMAPISAFACSCTPTVVGSTATTTGSGYDDPNIPNCVADPNASYPGGTCERVQIWVNFGHDIYDCVKMEY